ncbi:hypothetical protein D3C83_236250 [compost metagenome]
MSACAANVGRNTQLIAGRMPPAKGDFATCTNWRSRVKLLLLSWRQISVRCAVPLTRM